MKISEKEFKNLITKSKLPDADFVINPYVGCCHECIYCYAQFMRRFTGHGNDEWGSFMDVKVGGKLNLKGTDNKTILIGSVTDPYNPIEKKYRATRGVLQKMVASNTSAHVEILTKSPLILDDLELIKQLRDVSVGVSLSTMDEKFARSIEKKVVTPKQRVELIRKLHAQGIQVYVFVSPIFPIFLGWKDVVDTIADDADLFCFENLNLRANYKQDVLKMVKEQYPLQYSEFQQIFTDVAELRNYWLGISKDIDKYMKGKKYKTYFFHEEIRKD